MLAVSLWVEGHRQLHANHRPCAEAMGGTCVGDAHDVGASGHRRHQDHTVARQLHLLARRGWGCVRLLFGCVKRVCKHTELEKKKKNEK